jgi:hypothetical protein
MERRGEVGDEAGAVLVTQAGGEVEQEGAVFSKEATVSSREMPGDVSSGHNSGDFW